MSPWLLFVIFFTPAGPQAASIDVPSLAVCREQQALVRAASPVPVQMACYRLEEGV